MSPIVLSPLATGLTVLAGAVFLKQVMDPMTGPGPRSGQEVRTKCPTCNGTGKINCLCSHWSDSDVGCRTCSGSGRMGCSSCGGSGTGRPIPARLTINGPNRPF